MFIMCMRAHKASHTHLRIKCKQCRSIIPKVTLFNLCLALAYKTWSCVVLMIFEKIWWVANDWIFCFFGWPTFFFAIKESTDRSTCFLSSSLSITGVPRFSQLSSRGRPYTTSIVFQEFLTHLDPLIVNDFPIVNMTGHTWSDSSSPQWWTSFIHSL